MTKSLCSDLLKRHVTGHEARPGERKTKRLKVQHQTDGASRVTQACEACAGMHLKCEEKKPCTRCVKKNIPCRSDVSVSEPEPILQTDSSSLPVGENEIQARDPQLSSSTANGMVLASNGIHDYSNRHIEPDHGQQTLDYSHSDDMQQQADTVALTEYLGNVLPTFSDPFANLFANGLHAGTFTPRVVSDFGFESNIELNDIDLSFLDAYNTDIPFYYDGSPNNIIPASTPGDSTNSSDPSRSTAIGAEAYQKSYWKFKPKRQQSGFVEEQNLSLPAENGDHGAPESRIPVPRRMIAEKLVTRTRDRILAVILASCKRENLHRALNSFPSTDLLDILLQYYLSSPIVRPNDYIHVPTLDTSTARPEFLAAMISSGAVMTSDPALTKLGFAIQECIRIAVPLLVRTFSVSIS